MASQVDWPSLKARLAALIIFHEDTRKLLKEAARTTDPESNQ